MMFSSILFPDAIARAPEEHISAPAFFVDLNLDQVVAEITAGKQEYKLVPFFYAPLRDIDNVMWRQAVMQDLENPALFKAIDIFARRLRAMHKLLSFAEKIHGEHQQHRVFLDAVSMYCNGIRGLLDDARALELESRGFIEFREYLSEYQGSVPFEALSARTQELLGNLGKLRYTVLIEDLRVEIGHFRGEPDYGDDVQATFERFREGSAKEYSFSFIDAGEMNHIEAAILDRVAKLHPELFANVEQFYVENQCFQDSTIARFDREVQFYVAYLEYVARLTKTGLKFCYPAIVQDRKEVYDYNGFDVALASKLVSRREQIICNDFHLQGPERIIVVSGPNQGGKTTFARTFGQLHFLAGLGCSVPGTRAQLFLCDELFTHFETGENTTDQRGKLQDDLIRLREILERATSNSIIILNEIFTSTTVSDALVLSKKIAARLADLDLLCVWVTFLDELASFGDHTVSMVSTVVPENPAVRTYRIVRRRADGLAYALTLAEKYRLTHGAIRERIRV